MSRRSDSDQCGKRYLTSAAVAHCILTRRKMAHHSSLKTFHTTVFLTPGIFPKKEPPKRLDLVQEKGLAVCCGCALHSNSSPTVASDSTRLTAPR